MRFVLRLKRDATGNLLLSGTVYVGDEGVAASQSAKSLGVIFDEHIFSCTCI